MNVFLTIVTLGVYGPWAKVRKRRYLYAHLGRGALGYLSTHPVTEERIRAAEDAAR